MAIKEQLNKLKENWLLILLVLILFFVFSNQNAIPYSLTKSFGGAAFEMADEGIAASRSYTAPIAGSLGFAPNVELRKITKTASLSTEVKRGEFETQQSALRNIVTASNSFILNENVNRYGIGRKSYLSGSYQLKVETEKYDSVVFQLKEIGEVQSFNENTDDVTGRYTDLQIEINVEKERLSRFKDMLDDAKEVSDQIELSDRIFEQERRIKYYDDQLKNIDQRIDYSTVYFTLNEKRSDYANVAFVKISELIRNFVSSINSLFSLLFMAIPWAIAGLIALFIWRKYKH